QGFHDQRGAAGAETFVADFLVVLDIAALRLLDGPLDVVAGHLRGLGRADGGAQARVMLRVGRAQLGGNGNFAGQFGEDARALQVLRTFAVQDVFEFGMTCHSLRTRPRAEPWKPISSLLRTIPPRLYTSGGLEANQSAGVSPACSAAPHEASATHAESGAFCFLFAGGIYPSWQPPIRFKGPCL